MIEFEELRPSYSSFLEFVISGYNSEYINIYLGFLVILGTSVYIFQTRENIHIKLITWYFSLSFFTNFAYQMYHARIFDFIGIAISLVVILTLLVHKLEIRPFERTLIILTAVLLLHLLTLYLFGYFDKYDAADKMFLQRLVMVLRVFVLLFVILYFINFVKTEKHIDFIVSTFKYVGMAALFIMILQEVLFFAFGQSTVGLNYASGYIPVPRFASVAIEGGHFGRLLPTFLIYFLAQKRNTLKIGFPLLFLLGLSVTNISASLYGYLFFIIISIVITHLLICKIHRLKTFLIICGLIGLSICYYFYDYVLLFNEKVIGLLFESSDTYAEFSNRSACFILKSLSEFPLGIGFGVSDRFLPDGSYTDNGIYAIISQLSLLSFIFIFVFLYYWRFLLKSFLKNKRQLLNKCYAPHSLIMVLAMPFIFFFDIVWLYPGYILPFLILMTYINKLKENQRKLQISQITQAK